MSLFEKWITNVEWTTNKPKKLNKLKWINFRMCMLLIISFTKIRHDEYQWCMDSSDWKTNDWRRWIKRVIIDFLFCVTWLCMFWNFFVFDSMPTKFIWIAFFIILWSLDWNFYSYAIKAHFSITLTVKKLNISSNGMCW